MYLRDNTQDGLCFVEVYWNNCYKLPKELDGATIVDVGANVGMFTLACLHRGAGRIICYEPDVENFAVLEKNLAAYREHQSIITCNKAVWRSDRKEETVPFHSAGQYSAMHRVGIGLDPEKPGIQIPAVALDAILCAVGHVDILKIDAEGSEWPILYTSRELARVDVVLVEVHHGLPAEGSPYPCTADGVAGFLRQQGFVCAIERCDQACDLNWLVRAARKGA